MPRLRPIAGGLATVAAIGGMIIAAPAAHAIGAPAGCSSQSVSTPVRTNDARVVPLSFMCSINGGSVASVTIVTPPAHGTLTGPPETPLYTPAPGYTGPDQVTFRIVNAAGSSGDLSWPFQVFDGAGYAPQCFGVHPTYVHNDAAAEIRLNCFDEDLKQVTFSIASPPQHGTLSAITPDDFTPMAASLTPTEVTSEASVRYTADPGYTGSDSFTITGDDGHHTSPPATVNLTVGATANHAPICTPFGTAILAAGWPMQVLAACMDPDGDPVTITTTQDPAHGALGAWAVKWYGPSAATYTPDSGFTGADSVAIQATDAHGATSATATIPLTVQDTAPIPTINCAARLLSVTRNVTLTTPPMPCFTLTGAEAALTIGSPPSHGTATITSAGELSYAPDRNYIGPDVLTLHAVAGSATLDSQVVISVISNAKATILSGPPASSTTPSRSSRCTARRARR